MARYRYDTGFVTHAGNRRAANQDSLLLRRGSLGSQDFLLLAVADGMGGMARGELASGCATELLDGWWASELPALLGPAGPDWPGLESSLTVAVERINAAIRQRGADRPDQAGTTLTALFLFGAEYLILHTGDSRAYRLWDGPPLQLTRDHTWCAREQAAGRLTPEQAASHPMRHMLTSTLGVRESYELDRLRGRAAPGQRGAALQRRVLPGDRPRPAARPGPGLGPEAAGPAAAPGPGGGGGGQPDRPAGAGGPPLEVTGCRRCD